jgi:predicted metal-dependent hydrolase
VAADLVSRHSRWIQRHQNRIRSLLAARDARPGLDRGREIFFDGEPHRVVSIAAIDGRRHPSIQLANGRIVVTSAPFERRSTAYLLERWLRSEARRAVDARVASRAAEMSLAPSRVTIRDQRTRWGSASTRGTLSFSWRLVMCPEFVLDYVVVHELAHLKVAGHSARFWRLVEKHHSDARAARRWLRDHHDEIRHALD